MKKIALSLILACGVAMATEANATDTNATAPAADANKTEAAAPAAAAGDAAKGKTLFARCVSCHGQNAEKKALNNSKIIAGWDAAETEKALHGYKDGSYGGAMKGTMKAQVANLSDADIKDIAAYVATLPKPQ